MNVKKMLKGQRLSAFTLVEVLVVIAIIAILASVSVVTYNGIQDRARGVALKSDLSTAAEQVEIQVVMNKGAYPNGLPSSVKTSPGNVLQMVDVGEDTFCINGYGQNGLTMSYTPETGLSDGSCAGVFIGSSVGGAVPNAPADINLAAGGFANWTLSGGVTYDSSTQQLCLNFVSGSAKSPLFRVTDSYSVRISGLAKATQPSELAKPDSQVYLSSAYFGPDGQTKQENRGGWKGNGRAITFKADGEWHPFNWPTATGNGIEYIQFIVNSNPTSRTSDNCYKDLKVEVIY